MVSCMPPRWNNSQNNGFLFLDVHHAAENVFPLRTHSAADNLYKSKFDGLGFTIWVKPQLDWNLCRSSSVTMRLSWLLAVLLLLSSVKAESPRPPQISGLWLLGARLLANPHLPMFCSVTTPMQKMAAAAFKLGTTWTRAPRKLPMGLVDGLGGAPTLQ